MHDVSKPQAPSWRAQVPLADWIPRQGKDPHEALLKLTDEINSGLGRLLTAHSKPASDWKRGAQPFCFKPASLLMFCGPACAQSAHRFSHYNPHGLFRQIPGQYAEGYEEAQPDT